MSNPEVKIVLGVSGEAQVRGALGNVERAMGQFGTAAQAAQAALAPLVGLFSAGAAIGQLVSVQREFDKLNSSLKTVAGGSAAAAREMEWLKAFAKETPFGLAQATQGFIKMKALGLDPSRAALNSFGNTASAMGKDLNQMIEAVADASTGEFERLKEFGIKAKKEGDNVSLTFQGVTKTIGSNAAEITAYLEAIGNNQFAGAMAERAATLDGAIASLGDTWDELFRTISQQNAGSLMHDAVRLAEGAVTDLTTIITALNGATADNASQTGAMAAVQNGLATAFEAVAVLGVNVKYTLVQIGNELGGLAAQAAAVATGQFAQAAAIGKMMREDAERARAEVDATSARILNARQVAALGQPNNYDEPSVVRARAAAEAAAAATKAAAAKAAADAARQEAAAKKAAEAAAKDAKKAAEAELEWRRKSTLDMIKLWDDEAEAAKKAFEAARAGAMKLADAADTAQIASADQLAERLAAMRDEIAFIGLTTAQVAALNIAKAEQIIADQEIQLIMLRNTDASVVQIQALEREIALRKQLVAAMGQKATKEANTEAAKTAADEWQRTTQQIEQSLTDALMNGGKSGAEYIQGLFRTMVLRPIIQGVVQGGLGAIGMRLPSAGGASGAIGTAANIYSMYGAAGQAGAFVGSLGSAASYGTAIGSQQGAMLAAQEAGMGTLAGSAGSLGAALPWIGAGLAVLSLIKSLDDSGTYHTGGLGGYSAAGGAVMGNAAKAAGLGFNLSSTDYQASTEQASVAIAKSIAGMLDSTATTFGRQAGYFAATAFADDSSRSGAWGALMVKLGDQIMLDWKDGLDKWPGREFADGEAGAKAYAAAVAKDVRDYLLTQTPDWADAALAALGDSVTLEQLAATVERINATETALQGMGRASEAFASMGEDVASRLVAALGGAQAAAARMGSYYGNFYSDSERQAITRGQLVAAAKTAGIDNLPTDRAGYRALVDSTMASGNTALAAALIQYSDAFASTTEAISTGAAVVQSVATQSDDAARELQRAAEDRARQRIDLENQLLTLQGNTAELRRRELAAIDPANQGLQEQIWALEDLATATEKAAEATEKATAAQREAMATYREGLVGIIDASAAQTDATMAAFERGIAAQRKLAETSKQAADKLRTEVQGVFDTLQTATDNLFGTVATAQQGAIGQQAIRAALAAARATGVLPDQKSLSRAIDAATKGLDATQYTSQAEADYARLVLANELRSLQDISGNQLTEAERQVKAAESQLVLLDDALANAKTQLDIARGVKTDTATMAQLLATIAAESATRQQVAASALLGSGQSVYSLATGTGATASGQAFTRADALAAAAPFATGNANDALALYSAAQKSGFSLAQLERIYGLGAGALEAEVAKIEQALGVTLPRFAVGTNYVPHDMLAVLHQGEAVVPAAYNPAAGGVGGGARLERLVEGLTAEVQRLQAIVNDGNRHQRRTADAINGNPEQPMLVEVVA